MGLQIETRRPLPNPAVCIHRNVPHALRLDPAAVAAAAAAAAAANVSFCLC